MDPDLPLKPMALLLLVLGLAAKEPGEQGLATDVAIAAINDGRLDGAKLGTGLTQLIATGLIKAARWAKALENVSRASTLHAEVVREAIVRSLRGDPASMPKDLHALVEVLKELVVESQSAIDGAAREFLEQLSGSGKLAKSAKSILAAKPLTNVERIQSIQRRAVEIGLDRAERWSRNGH